MIKTELEDEHVRDHRIVPGIRIFRYFEVFLHDTPTLREERPMSADTAAKFVCLGYVVGADRDEAARVHLHLSMGLQKSLSRSAVLGERSAAAEDENYWVQALQSR